MAYPCYSCSTRNRDFVKKKTCKNTSKCSQRNETTPYYLAVQYFHK